MKSEVDRGLSAGRSLFALRLRSQAIGAAAAGRFSRGSSVAPSSPLPASGARGDKTFARHEVLQELLLR